MLSLLTLLLLLSPLATDAATFNCSSSATGCLNGNCVTTTGSCTCPTDSFLTFSGDRCEQANVVSVSSPTKLSATATSYLSASTIDLTSNAAFKGGIPLSNTELATKIYVCSNGYVTFNYAFCTTRIDLLKSQDAPSFVAPFATSFDFRSAIGSVTSVSEVSHVLVPSVDAEPKLKLMRDSNTNLAGATAAVVVTWSKMSPPTLDVTKAQQQATFQLILFTDFDKATTAVMLYSTNTLKDYFDWLPTLIGIKPASTASQQIYTSTRSTSVALSLKQETFGAIKATMKVQPVYRGTANYRYQCLSEASAALDPPIVSDIVGWCPRSLKQARVDPRYSSSANQTVFSLITSTVTNATQITCAYDEATGGLLSLNSYSNITSGSANVTMGAKLYEYCCDREPSLCSNYYGKFPTPTSQMYKNPSAVGFAMGAGQLRSFDGLLSRYQAVGDFWLLYSPGGKLNVQVRAQNVNPGANNSAGITGVALQFSGTANLSVEFHWSKSTRQVASVHYSVNSGQQQNTTLAAPLKIVSDGAVLMASQTSVTCYVLGTSTWLSAKSNPNGMLVSVYLDKRHFFNSTAGLLGNYDDSTANDVAMKDGTVTGTTQENVDTAMASWKVASNDSLFKVLSAEPTAESGWAAVYWSATWSTNQTALVEALFGGNDTVFAAANQSCSPQLSNSGAYQNCLMEYADCTWNSPATACSVDYLNQLSGAGQFVTDFVTSCSTLPQWNSGKTEVSGFVSATEGASFQLLLATLVTDSPSGATFAKVSGPSGLNVAANGSLTWTPALSDLSPIVVSVSTAAGCSSLLHLSVRLTRATTGVCPNSAEGFDYLTPANENYRRDRIYLSACQCNANYYTSNCSFATCPLDCHTCSSTSATTCAAACPANYEQSSVGLLKVCSYLDRCTSSLCTGTGYKACRSVDPALQSSSLRYQCICDSGFQYPSGVPVNRTVCSDVNECLSPVYCDQTKNLQCTNTEGSFTCTCKTGYSLQSGQCQDINECAATGICPNANCVNTPGAYYCNCSAGFYVASAGQNCSDINECSNPALSGCKQNCNNTDGSFTCGCYANFGTPPNCPATTPCTNASVCSYPDMCAKINSSDTCHCPPAQTLQSDGRACSAKTYCTDGICGSGGTCTETNPGYNCTCKQHYELNAAMKCVPSDYCNRRSMYPAVCPAGNNVDCSVNSTNNAPTCGCVAGFALNNATNTCQDVNECAAGGSAGCDSAATDCLNLMGSFKCACKFGYKRINATHCTPAPYAYKLSATFTDLTFQASYADSNSEAFKQAADLIEKKLEAALPIDGSDASQPTVRVSRLSNGSVVADSVASYATSKTPAALASGAAAAGLTVTATLLNECENASLNECSATVHNCVDTVNGYTCQCKSGYTQTGTVSGFAGTTKVIAVCADIDECLTQCRNGSNKVCVNLPGSFTCSCANGTYSASPVSQPCEDPCVAGRCKNGGQCQYQARDQFPYRCVCPAGYVGFHCELVDEHYKGMQRNAIIIGVVLGVLLLLCVAVVVFFYIRKYRKDKSRADFYQSNFSDNPVARSGGTYKGTEQSMALSDASIPRAHHSAQHPSSYENNAYERETHKTRTDYF